mgnify:CR=1 FL=1
MSGSLTKVLLKASEVEQLRRFFSSYSNPTRLAILEQLRYGEKSVSEIAEAIRDVSLTNLSNHLKCMRGCGILKVRREWRNLYYSVSDERILAIFSIARDVVRHIGNTMESCPVDGKKMCSTQ